MSIYGNLDFLDLGYRPKETDVVLVYTVTQSGMTVARAAELLAGESSIGTWTKIQTMNPVIAKTLRPHVFFVDEKTGEVRIAYPELLFEPGNMPGILSSIAGNIYGMKGVDKLRLEDIRFTKRIMDGFKGPQFGVEGVRKITGIYDRPLLGTIVKPKVGLTAEQHARVAYEAWAGGLDVVKDDENLVSMAFNTFDERMKLTLAARDRAEQETGQKKIYLANITAETDEMKRRALVVKRLGGEFVMIDILTAGWAAVQTMRNFCGEQKLAIHAHRAMHGALTRDPRHGISMVALAKIARLVGVDQLHIGTADFGKMEGSADLALTLEREIESGAMPADELHHVLRQEWRGVKPTLVVASGGLSPLATPGLLKVMGPDTVMQYGGGCHGHPDGTRAGAAAIRQSLDAALAGIPLAEYAQTHPELARALGKWGTTTLKEKPLKAATKKAKTAKKSTKTTKAARKTAPKRTEKKKR